MAQAQPTAPKKNSVLKEILLFKESFVELLSQLCGKWAGVVYDNTGKVCLFALLVIAASFLGFIPGVMKFIDGAENLYAMPNTVARYDGLVHNSIFKESLTYPNFLIVSTDPPGGNILTWENLHIVRQIDNLIRGKVVDPHGGRRLALPPLPQYLPHKTNKGTRMPSSGVGSNINSTAGISPYLPLSRNYVARVAQTTPAPQTADVLTYEDICAVSPFNRCQVMSVFEMGVWDLKKILPPGSPPEFYVMQGNIFNLEKKGFVPDYVLGQPEIEDCERELPTNVLLNIFPPEALRPGSVNGKSKVTLQCVKSAKALQMIYELEDQPEYRDRNIAWMDMYYKVLSDNQHFGGLLFGGNAFKSRDDELRKSTSESSDVIFVVFTFIIVISYTAAMNFSCDLYKNKSLTALSGSISALLGIICGFGYGSLLGIAFVPTALVTPFLIMGVGTDDIFVLVNSYSLSYCEANSRERCVRAFQDCGVSVILTKATSLIAFAVGCQSPYVSIRNFCLFSLLGLSFSVFFEFTLFFSVLCLEAKRENEKNPCFFVSNTQTVTDEVDENVLMNNVVRSLFQDRKISTFELATYQVAHDWQNRARYQPFVAENVPKIKFSNVGNVIHYPSAHDPVFLALAKQNHKNSEVEDIDSPCESPRRILDAKDVGETSRMLKDCMKPVLEASTNPMFYSEPQGTVGRAWRLFFRNCFCVHLLTPGMKILVLLAFTLLFGLAIRGVFLMELGLNLKDLSPDTAYLRVFDSLNDQYFGQYDIPVYIFFPEQTTPWWDHRVHKALTLLDKKLRDQPSTVFFNDPLKRMIEDPALHGALTSGDRHVFERTLKEHLGMTGGKYKQFEKDFVWEGSRLIGWKITLLPAGMSTSQERASWMRQIRQDCLDIEIYGKQLGQEIDDLRNDSTALRQPSIGSVWPLKATAWNYMMIFYESDLHLISSVISSMTTAMISMLVAALILIPEFMSGMLVIFVMSLIDLAVMGFMYYWNVKLQMITMICLVISIGFSIDYSAHICHTFTHCLGRTKNLRTVECVVLMGTPVFHGAASTIAGIFVLGYSQSFIFRLFFKMLTMTLLFGIAHGLVLLPVILSLIGKMSGPPISARANALIDQTQLKVQNTATAKAQKKPREWQQNRTDDDKYSVATIEIPRHELHFQPTHWPAWDAPAPLNERLSKPAFHNIRPTPNLERELNLQSERHNAFITSSGISAGITSAAAINQSDPASATRGGFVGAESSSVATSTNRKQFDRHVLVADAAFQTLTRHGRSRETELSPIDQVTVSRPASSMLQPRSARWSDMSARDVSCVDNYARDFSPVSSNYFRQPQRSYHPRSTLPHGPSRIATDTGISSRLPRRPFGNGSSSDGRSETAGSCTSDWPGTFSEFMRVRTADHTAKRPTFIRSDALRQSLELARTIDQRWQLRTTNYLSETQIPRPKESNIHDTAQALPDEADTPFYTSRETRPISRKVDNHIRTEYMCIPELTLDTLSDAPPTPAEQSYVVHVKEDEAHDRLPRRKQTVASDAIANIKTPRLHS